MDVAEKNVAFVYDFYLDGLLGATTGENIKREPYQKCALAQETC